MSVVFKDRVVEYPSRYTMTQNSDGTVTLTPSPGTVVEPGTPLNANNLNELIPKIGDIKQFPVIPDSSWLPCDGRTITKAEYPMLYEKLAKDIEVTGFFQAIDIPGLEYMSSNTSKIKREGSYYVCYGGNVVRYSSDLITWVAPSISGVVTATDVYNIYYANGFYYLYVNNYKVYRGAKLNSTLSTDWTLLSTSFYLSERLVKQLFYVDNILYFFFGSGYYKSENNGVTWSSINMSPSHYSLYSVVYHKGMWIRVVRASSGETVTRIQYSNNPTGPYTDAKTLSGGVNYYKDLFIVGDYICFYNSYDYTIVYSTTGMDWKTVSAENGCHIKYKDLNLWISITGVYVIEGEFNFRRLDNRLTLPSGLHKGICDSGVTDNTSKIYLLQNYGSSPVYNKPVYISVSDLVDKAMLPIIENSYIKGD